MNRALIHLSTIFFIGVLILPGCKPDESLKVLQRPTLEIQEGDRHLTHGDWLRVQAPRQAHTQPQSVPLTLRNTGTSPLEIYSIDVLGAHQDRIKIDSDTLPSRQKPIVIAPGTDGQLAKGFGIKLTSTSAKHDLSAQLKIVTNPDHRGKNVHLIDVVVEAAQPMLVAVPDPIDFGMELKAQDHRTLSARFVNSGSETLEVLGFQLVGDKGFAIEVEGSRWSVDAVDINKGIRLKERVLLEPGHHMRVPVHFTALHDGPAGARLTVRSTDPTSPEGLTIPISANGGNGVCPTPSIRVKEGMQVCPQTLLHLSGEGSEVASGLSVARYGWKVTAPDGVYAEFISGQTSANATIAVNAAGKYTFQLRATDSYGTETGTDLCPDAEVIVNVVPCDALHVELIWDEAGSSGGSADIDLHMLHPLAVGNDIDGDGQPDGWFDHRYDVTFSNMVPDWETGSSEDDPRLDLDDTDGGGPENINLDKPVSDRVYRIGAHYWEDLGGGDTSVTVRIFIRGELVHEARHDNLRRCELWEVATIEWPSATVKAVTDSAGAKKIGRRCSEEVDMDTSYTY
jgi:hypothetical protein